MNLFDIQEWCIRNDFWVVSSFVKEGEDTSIHYTLINKHNQTGIGYFTIDNGEAFLKVITDGIRINSLLDFCNKKQEPKPGLSITEFLEVVVGLFICNWKGGMKDEFSVFFKMITDPKFNPIQIHEFLGCMEEKSKSEFRGSTIHDVFPMCQYYLDEEKHLAKIYGLKLLKTKGYSNLADMLEESMK